MPSRAYPSTKSLFLAWLTLMALTIGTIIAGRVTAQASLGLVPMAGLMSVTWAKATVILQVYLDLKAAGDGWSKFFISLVTVILLVVFVIFAVLT